MNTLTRKIAGLFALLAMFVFYAGPMNAQESKAGHSHAKAEMHGGSVFMSQLHHFEVVFKPNGIRVYLYDGRQKPLSAKGVKGQVTLKFRDGKSETLPLQVVAATKMMEHKDEKGKMHEGMHEKQEKSHHDSMPMSMQYLQAKVDLSKISAGQMKAVFSLEGLPNEKETKATFTETFRGLKKAAKSHHNDEKGDHHKEMKHEL